MRAILVCLLAVPVFAAPTEVKLDPEKPATLELGRIRVTPGLSFRFSAPDKLTIGKDEWKLEGIKRDRWDKGYVGALADGVWTPEPGVSGRAASVIYQHPPAVREYPISASCLGDDDVNVEFVDATGRFQAIQSVRRGDAAIVRVLCFSNAGKPLADKEVNLEPEARFKPATSRSGSDGIAAFKADTAELPAGGYVARAFVNGKLKGKLVISVGF